MLEQHHGDLCRAGALVIQSHLEQDAVGSRYSRVVYFGVLPFLVGEMALTQRAPGDTRAGGVQVTSCKVLEESGCSGLCLNMCKRPTEKMFAEKWGVPLYMQPNFETRECSLSFGVVPVPVEEDEAVPQGCLSSCPMQLQGHMKSQRCASGSIRMTAEEAIDGKAAAGALASSALLAEGVQYLGTALALAYAQERLGCSNPVETVSTLIEYVQGLGASGYALFAVTMIGLQVMPVANAFLLTVTAGAIFGAVPGTLLVLMCSTVERAPHLSSHVHSPVTPYSPPPRAHPPLSRLTTRLEG